MFSEVKLNELNLTAHHGRREDDVFEWRFSEASNEKYQ